MLVGCCCLNGKGRVGGSSWMQRPLAALLKVMILTCGSVRIGVL